MQIDPSIYIAHAAFWGAFGVTRAIAARPGSGQTVVAEVAPVSEQARSAPFSRALLGFHMAGFAAMYGGIGSAVFSGRIPHWLAFQRSAGCLVIATGSVLTLWALLHFRSWRFRAKLDQGHQLATDGPFRHLRHPIYMGLNLLALGSAIWIPTPLVWAGFVLIAIGSDLRGRSEEKLLNQAFGGTYSDYCRRTSRFVPRLY